MESGGLAIARPGDLRLRAEKPFQGQARQVFILRTVVEQDEAENAEQ
jgi:hypothetical protein